MISTNPRKEYLKGSQLVADIVGSTMGARGKFVAVRRNQLDTIAIMDDGSSVAKAIVPDNPLQRIASDLIIRAAIKTSEQAGDGTTLTTVLTNELFQNMDRYGRKIPPVILKERIEFVSNEILKLLTKKKRKATNADLKRAVDVSIKDKAISTLLLDAINKAGEYGDVRWKHAPYLSKSNVEEVNLYKIPKGFIHNSSINNPKEGNYQCAKDKLILINGDFTIAREGWTPEEQLIKWLLSCGAKHTTVICGEMTKEAIHIIMSNAERHGFKVNLISFGRDGAKQDVLEDLSCITSAKVINPAELTSPKDFANALETKVGEVEMIQTDANSTAILKQKDSEKRDDFKDRLAFLVKKKKELEDEGKDIHEDLKLREIVQKLSRLSSKIVWVNIAAKSESEFTIIAEKIKDGFRTYHTVKQTGTIVGGGVTPKDIALSIKGKKGVEYKIWYHTLLQPIKQISKNAGIKFKLKEVMKPNVGYEVTKRIATNLKDKEIVDTYKSLEIAIENAVSVACSISLSEFAIYEE